MCRTRNTRQSNTLTSARSYHTAKTISRHLNSTLAHRHIHTHTPRHIHPVHLPRRRIHGVASTSPPRGLQSAAFPAAQGLNACAYHYKRCNLLWRISCDIFRGRHERHGIYDVFLLLICILDSEAQNLVTFYQICHSSAHMLVTFLQIRHNQYGPTCHVG